MTELPHPPVAIGEGALRMRVLVVDDLADAADTTAALLALHGAEVEACYAGQTALARVAAFRPDACILDLNMPGLDGLCLAECILVAAGARPLLVALTGYDDEDTRRRVAEGAFDHFLVKPADPVELVTILSGHLAHLQAAG